MMKVVRIAMSSTAERTPRALGPLKSPLHRTNIGPEHAAAACPSGQNFGLSRDDLQELVRHANRVGIVNPNPINPSTFANALRSAAS